MNMSEVYGGAGLLELRPIDNPNSGEVAVFEDPSPNTPKVDAGPGIRMPGATICA